MGLGRSLTSPRYCLGPRSWVPGYSCGFAGLLICRGFAGVAREVEENGRIGNVGGSQNQNTAYSSSLVYLMLRFFPAE